MTARAFPGDPPLDAALVARHKLDRAEWDALVAGLGREPTYTELGVASVMWSEHCSYKSSRLHLRRLPTEAPHVIQGPGENAGVVDIGDGFAAVFKMESHNHPSYLEPYQGAATGVGGILRDVFTMGARPVASLDSLRFGRPEHPRTPALLRGVVAGVGGYGNCIGVPTVGGELMFDSSYDGNCLVNAFTCGVARTDGIFYGRAGDPGSSVLYVGARTGRDGIHGATMASDEFSASGPSQRPTVQVGDPFLGKLLLEACLRIFEEDLLIGIQDMGAAGLTSSSVEMAGRSGAGLELDLDLVPRRATRMTPYELLLSESQERMLMVARPGQEERVREICEHFELDCAVIGRVTDTGRWVVKATPGHDPTEGGAPGPGSVVVCDFPVALLTEAAPRYDRPQGDDPSAPERLAFDPASLGAPASWGDALLELLSSPNVGSRRWVFRQYDHIVRGGTAVRPGSDAAVVRVPCERDGLEVMKHLAFACDCNARFVLLDPFVGAAMAVAEACRNLACSGARPLGLTDCLNFGSPERPHVMRTFARAIDGMAEACRALGVPVVSGNVSLYNETDGRAILPTPTVAVVGLVSREAAITRAFFQRAGDTILLLGAAASDGLGGSEWVHLRTGEVKGPAPALDLDLEVRLQRLVVELCEANVVASAHDLSEGGLAVGLAECCAGPDDPDSMVGASVTLPAASVPSLFGEAPTRVLVSAAPADVTSVLERARAAGVPAAPLGETGGARLRLEADGRTIFDLDLTSLRAARERCLTSIVGE
ncbi:MAG: phosphoribosylformylglycinamidine synthase subunit PurL [Polyangiaceae bacterium]|nr:phosphoribosylformylglycinamidine synthase subunit PurL [Polyangiaceae bacterium]